LTLPLETVSLADVEFKQEAVRLVEGGQSIAAAARTLVVHIRAVHAETHGSYGWPRVWRTCSTGSSQDAVPVPRAG
jgi:hypothetical protein